MNFLNQLTGAIIMIVLCLMNLSNSSLQAQDGNIYYIVDYMKSTPGMTSEYLELEGGVWKNIHRAQQRAGDILGWSVYSVVSPYGSSAAYDYVTITAIQGEDKLANFYEEDWFENYTKNLSAEEKKQVGKTGELRTFVKSETYRWRSAVSDGQTDGPPPSIMAVNYMKLNNGVSGPDLLSIENEIWKPIHEARVKDNMMRGWILSNLVMPYGSSTTYDVVTVDMYDSLEDRLTGDMGAYFEKVHAGMDMDKALTRTSDARDIVIGQIWQLADYLD